MKHVKLFFALFAMLALGVGNAWGAEATIKFSEKGLENGVQYSDPFTIDANTTITFAGGGNDGKYYNTGTGIRTYGDGTITVECTNGTISEISFTWSGTSYKPAADVASPVGYSTSTDKWTGSASSVTLTRPSGSGHWRLQEVTVTYETAGGGEPTPSLTTDPTTIDFGTVYEGATVADKTVAVNFANLTGAVTYSGLSTPFSATGAISATGDKITISADASTIGAYSQTLTIASTADSKTAEVTVKMNVVEKPAPTGTFTLHTGDLIEGDYVIYYSGKAMKAVVSSNRLGYEEVTPSGNEIIDPLAETIWHIAPSGSNWTIYNDNKGYAAGNGTKNQAALVADLTGDNANKAAWTVTASDNAYEFVNVWNKSKSVNANLRNNTTYGFACYATSTGGALSLYRKAGAKYNVTVNSTTNGSVTASPTSAEAGATIALTVTPDAGYVLDAITVTDASSNTIEVADNKFTMPASDVTVSATFKVNEAPDAVLQLMANGEEVANDTHKVGYVATLPTTIENDCAKTFVGWSENENCTTEPEYAPGAEFTLTKTEHLLCAVYADGTSGEPVNVFSETFDACEGKGGNDADGWSGSIASGTLTLTDWTCENGTAANGCAKFGTGSKKGSAETPAITLTGAATLTFKAAAWNGSSEGTTLNVSATGATLDMTSVTLTKAEWTEYTIAITDATGSVKIKFQANSASNNRFFLDDVVVSQASVTYSNFSTTCSAAPKAEVNPTTVTATAAGVEGKVTVTYENVNTANVAVALFNDEACAEAFTAGWLTASLDGDKNITYTITATTLYTERKAYIQLTAPEENGATEPAKVVIPVTQAGKDKVFASLEALLAAVTPTAEGVEVTVTLTNELIVDFYTSGSFTNGIALNVPYQGGTKQIEIYCKDVPTDWVKGGKVSGTITCPWKLYNTTWELCPTAWKELTYTAPATVKSIAVSGTPTKTTYVDGEVFDPAGLVVTATLTDDSTEPIDFTLVDWTFDPATLAKGHTSVNVTATYNNVSSAAYEVTGLTVNDIPTKTVAEFIAAKGTRCYLEGIVSNITNTTYGNFELTDASGTIYVYGCLNAGESQKFAELGVKNGDKIKVIADEYELYQGTKSEAKNVQYVSHISAATITIADITMEVGEIKDITADITPAAAETAVVYTIKENTDNAISLSGNTITANAVGTATITATIATAAEYMGKTVDFTVTVNAKSTKETVVILAQCGGQWYAMTGAYVTGKTNVLAAIPVEYINGTLYNVADADKSSIEWERSMNGNKATFKNNDKYLAGGTSADLTLKTTIFEWDYNGVNYLSGNTTTKRTFLYCANTNYSIYGFKNYAISNIGKVESDGAVCYSLAPEVVAPVYATAEIYTRDVTTDDYGTICLPYGSSNYAGAEFYEISWMEMNGTNPKGIWLDQVNGALTAGKPYIFKATDDKIAVAYEGTAVTSPIAGEAGLTGTFTLIQDIETSDPSNTLEGNYMISGNQFLLCPAGCWLNANRAYIDATIIANHTTKKAEIPGRRRVCLGETSENEATGLDNNQLPITNIQKAIENGQLIIIRDGVKYNVQGQVIR